MIEMRRINYLAGIMVLAWGLSPAGAAPPVTVLTGVRLSNCECGSGAGGCDGRYRGRRIDIFFVFGSYGTLKSRIVENPFDVLKGDKPLKNWIDIYCPSPAGTPERPVVDMSGRWKTPDVFRADRFYLR